MTDSETLWVPRTSLTSCDQAVFVDHATDTGLFSDSVLLKIDRFGERFKRSIRRMQRRPYIKEESWVRGGAAAGFTGAGAQEHDHR